MSKFTPAEQSVIDALIRHSSLNEEPTLARIAEECHVAKSTVVKAVQKLGFAGFKDFVYTYRLRSSIQSERLLPKRVTEGDFDTAAKELQEVFLYGLEKKNIAYSGGGLASELLSAYISRKLGMFDIFAPASYDYALADRQLLKPGFLLAFAHGMPYNISQESEAVAFYNSQLSYFSRRGFKIVLITDRPCYQREINADKVLGIAPPRDENQDADLYISRVIMLFEATLSQLATSFHELEAGYLV